jgi:hypothetical protein
MQMHENGYISDSEYAAAKEAPMVTAHGGAESTDAPTL